MSTTTPTTEAPKRGTTVYDLYGQMAQVQTALPDGSLLVGLMFEGIDYDSRGSEMTIEFEGPLQVWHNWYLSPPVQKKAEQVAELEKELSDARTELQRLRAEKAAELRKVDDRMRFLKQYEGLQRLDDFLSHKITHVVYTSWDRIEIMDTTQWENLERRGCRDGLRLLTLYGDSKGDLNWRLGEYYDHSGSNYQAFPCLSKEEALAKVEGLAAAQFSNYLATGQDSGLSRTILSCQKLSIPVPEEVLAKMNATKHGNLEKQIEAKRLELQALEAQAANTQPEVEG